VGSWGLKDEWLDECGLEEFGGLSEALGGEIVLAGHDKFGVSVACAGYGLHEVLADRMPNTDGEYASFVCVAAYEVDHLLCIGDLTIGKQHYLTWLAGCGRDALEDCLEDGHEFGSSEIGGELPDPRLG
jgi:hypothetical protein